MAVLNFGLFIFNFVFFLAGSSVYFEVVYDTSVRQGAQTREILLRQNFFSSFLLTRLWCGASIHAASDPSLLFLLFLITLSVTDIHYIS